LRLSAPIMLSRSRASATRARLADAGQVALDVGHEHGTPMR
jgi:hypothetical protein